MKKMNLEKELKRIEENIRSLSMEEFERIMDECGINRPLSDNDSFFINTKINNIDYKYSKLSSVKIDEKYLQYDMKEKEIA